MMVTRRNRQRVNRHKATITVSQLRPRLLARNHPLI